MGHHIARRGIRHRLRQQQRHGGGGSRNSHVAMYEKVPQAFGVTQNVLAKLEHFGDVFGLGSPELRRFFDDIVKFQLQPRMLSIGPNASGSG